MSRRDVLAAGLVTGTATAAGLGPDANASGSAERDSAPGAGLAAGPDRTDTAGDLGDPITPAPVLPVEPGDTPDRIMAKAARIVPRPAHVAWQRREVIAFTHFGMNTFTGREWGSGMEPASRFDPPRVDVEQWMRVYRDLGAELVILTAKHHDGFVLYPTRYTRHSVAAAPWWKRSGGRGDVLGAYVRAARAAGLRVGVYLSPSDGAELPHAWHAETYIPYVRSKPESERSSAERATLEDAPAPPSGHGRYGNGSPVVPRTIPTLVEGDDREEAVRTGALPSFEVALDDYDAYYLNQIYELLTEYGPIDELWMDGANPWADAGIRQDYDFTTFFRVIAELSPETVVFQGPQGVRWVGNEDGRARPSEWSVVPATGDPDTAYNEFLIPGGASAADIGSREVLTGGGVRSLQWFPAEADFSIRPGWFHHADERPKTPTELMDRYLTSVGRNAVMLLNVPPGPDGRIDRADHEAVRAFRRSLDATYGVNLLAPSGPDADELLVALTDGEPATGWSPPDGASTGALVLRPERAVTFDRIRLGEDITRGQHVEEFVVDVRQVDDVGLADEMHTAAEVRPAAAHFADAHPAAELRPTTVRPATELQPAAAHPADTHPPAQVRSATVRPADDAQLAGTGGDIDRDRGTARGPDDGWTTVAAGTTIGYSRILVLDEPVTASHLRIRIERARDNPRLAFVGLYRNVPPR